MEDQRDMKVTLLKNVRKKEVINRLDLQALEVPSAK